MMRSRYGWTLALMMLVLCAVTSGCFFQSISPMDIYTLEPGWNQNDPVHDEKKGSTIIEIAPVRGSAAFTGTEIYYTDIRQSQHSYAYSRWRDAPVKSIQTILEAILGKSGLFAAVLPSSSVSKADFVLESTLLEFGHFLADDGSSTGIVRMRFHFVDNKSKALVASKELVSRMPVASLDARGATAAINQAANTVANDCVRWLGTLQ